MASLRLYMHVPRTRTLGPGVRYALWVQGCPFRCPGCLTPDALSSDGGHPVPIDALAEDILATDGIEGLTLTGGEPFAQAEPLAALIRRVRDPRDLGVIVYSGYRLETLRRLSGQPSGAGIAALLRETDLLIDGLYVAALDDGRSLRGSANQRAHPLTDRYRAALDQYGQPRRVVEMHIVEETLQMVGVPGPEMLARWQARFYDTASPSTR